MKKKSLPQLNLPRVMKIKTLVSLTLLAGAASAQTVPSSTLYDDNGNFRSAGSGMPAPGDLLSSIFTGASNNSGLAPFQGNLVRTNSGDGAALIYEIDASTGSQINTYPTSSTGDFGLAYDTTRDLFVTCNASTDVLKGYTPGNGAPVFSISTVGSGPVGVAYDSSRDEYGVCDWINNNLYIYDATTLANVRTFPIGGSITRLAGVAYDCTSDRYIVGGRDQSAMAVVNPVNGAVDSVIFTAVIGNNPQGLALSSIAGVFSSEWQTGTLYEQESNHPPGGHSCIGGGVGTPICFGDGSGVQCPCGNNDTSGSAGCSNSSGSGCGLAGSGSGSIAAGDLVLNATNAIPGEPGLFFQGNVLIGGGSGVIFGDGLRCAGQNVVRLQVVLPDAAGDASSSVNIASTGGAVAGDTRHFQYWYRNPGVGPCGTGFNLSNALSLTWTP